MAHDPDDAGRDPAEEEDDDGWRFGLDDVDEEGIVSRTVTIEPGDPELEHVVFVALGALSTILLVVALVYL